jgi:hypothetical protein
MMLIELALLRFSRAAFFKHLLLLGHGGGSRCIRELDRDGWDDSHAYESEAKIEN